jgi:hypothetical protein
VQAVRVAALVGVVVVAAVQVIAGRTVRAVCRDRAVLVARAGPPVVRRERFPAAVVVEQIIPVQQPVLGVRFA